MAEERVIKIRVTSKDAEKNIKNLTKDFGKLEDETKKAGKGIESTGKGFKRLGGAAKIATNLVIGATKAAAAAATAIIGVAINAAKTTKELELLSTQAKTSVEDFQSLAFATSQFGVNAEQIADISKDVSDKVGEFSKVGTGAFQDFVDVIGITKAEGQALAKEFESLSSEEVIGQVVKRLEAAGASANQTTFVLESLGNDLSKLSPLFADNARQLTELKKRYDAANETLQLTRQEARDLQELGSTFDILTSQIGNAATEISATVAPTLNAFFEGLIEIIPEATQDIKDFINSLRNPADISSLEDLTTQLNGAQRSVNETRQQLAEQRQKLANEESEFIQKLIKDTIKLLEEQLATEQKVVDAIINRAKELKKIDEQEAKTKPKRQDEDQSTGGKTPTGDDDFTKKEFERIQKRLQLETEGLEAQAELKRQFREGEISAEELDFMLEQERIQAQYEQRRAAVEENETISAEQKKALKEELQNQEDIALLGLQEAQSQASRDLAESDARFALNFFAGQSKKVFKIKKAVALGEAAIKGTQSAIDAWEAGMSTGGPTAPAVAAAYTAASLAKTGALISQIKSQQYGGSGSGGGAGGGGGSVGTGVNGGDSITQRPDVIQRNIGTENTELNLVRQELATLDSDFIPTDLARRLIGAIDDNLEAGTATSSTIGEQ